MDPFRLSLSNCVRPLQAGMLARLAVAAVGVVLVLACSAQEHTSGEVGLSPGSKRRFSLPLNNPEMIGAADAHHMRPDDMVVGIVVAGMPRAYPWWIVRHYHVVNETVLVQEPSALEEGWGLQRPKGVHASVEAYVPLLITLCEACSGASVFLPVVDAFPENPLVFSQCRAKGAAKDAYKAVGVYTICDLQTQSRWHPFSGRAGSGRLEGERLERRPVFQERWGAWLERHPHTTVALAGDEMRRRPHGDAAIAEPGVHPTYRRQVERTGHEDTRLARHAMVLGVGDPARSDAVAAPLEVLRSLGGVVPVEVAGEPFVLVLSGEYRAMVYRATLDGEMLALRRADGEPFRLEDASGSLWNDRGEGVAGPHSGRRLEPAADSYLVEWSDWISEHPRTRLLEGAGGSAR